MNIFKYILPAIIIAAMIYAIPSAGFLLSIAAATLVSEDLTCIGAGVLAANKQIGLGSAVFACFAGIFAGDILLFIAGRQLGRNAAKRAPFKWFLRAEDIERASAWFSRRGALVILTSRFVPGMRLPTYFAAGLLNTSFRRFALYFSLAAAIWTPLLVGLSKMLGAEAIESALLAGQSVFIKTAIAGVAAYLLIKLSTKLLTWRGRRLFVSSWRRITRWEFWPPWIFYLPVIFYLPYLMLKYRGLTLFTAANPAIIGGGFIGESKIDILRGLSRAEEFVARAALIECSSNLDDRIDRARDFMTKNGFDYPVVLKPNEGQRGSGVAIIGSDAELKSYLGQNTSSAIIQEYAPGAEFGIFYYRYPGAETGHIFSITEKRMPVLTGDGVSDLEHLILNDDRAVCMARFHLGTHRSGLCRTPHNGERVQLVELGTHCRGAIFLDGGWIKTAELEETFDLISKSYAGFYFGRYDVRTPSIEDFKQGSNFKIVELNGVTSEATHIYDPKNSLFSAYKTLFEQWRIAFEIGALNRRCGAQPASTKTLMKLIVDRISPYPLLT